jgi:GntR family transcriptional regulator, transcriptional repressor for pyruvate dehydrogenase complex
VRERGGSVDGVDDVADRGEQAPSQAGLSERLAAGLLEMMTEERLRPGDTMPTVRSLAERFGVTVPTMREALRRLQATDAVQLRHGSGSYVGPGVLRTLLPNPNSVPFEGTQILYLVEARLAIEPSIAALAARQRTEEQLARLESTLGDTRDTRDAPGARTARNARTGQGGRLNFHRELASASGNPVLFEVVDSLLTARSREQRAVRRLVPDRARDLDRHRAIYEAVHNQDPDAAEELTRQHLLELRENTAARLTN